VKEHYRGLAPEYGFRANRTCEKMYLGFVKQFLGQKGRVLEVRSGRSDLLDRLGSPFAVGCDLSLDMLRVRSNSLRLTCIVAAGEALPLQNAHFDGVFFINVLEHVTSPETVVAECARVLKEDGVWLGHYSQWQLGILARFSGALEAKDTGRAAYLPHLKETARVRAGLVGGA
jgi:ubiquinone/menaquinone biosynthesis C-methylase UbiE